MRTIEQKNLEERWPNNRETNVFNVDSDVANYYVGQYALYEHFLYLYLLKNTSIGKFDKDILNNKLKIGEVLDSNKDLYQSGSPLKYLYVRNNIYVERLSEEDLGILQDKMIKGIFELDNDTEELIKRTYKVVTAENVDKNVNNAIFYGPTTNSFLAINGDLIIGIRYDDEIKSFEDVEFIRQNEILEFISDLSNKINNTMSSELETNVKTIVYDDNTIIKMNSDLNEKIM